MKVILKSEVDNLGLTGDVVDVADGYGRNYLLPRGLAIIATQGAMKEAHALTRSRKAAESKTLGAAESAKEILESRTLRIAARVDDRGSLYGSVSAVDVARVLKERGHDIPRKRIDLKSTIKVIGTYEIPVQVHPQVVATVSLEVVDEEGVVTVTEGGGIVNADEVEPPPLLTEGAESAEELEALKQEAIEAAEALDAEGDLSAAPSEEVTEAIEDDPAPGAPEAEAAADADGSADAGTTASDADVDDAEETTAS